MRIQKIIMIEYYKDNNTYNNKTSKLNKEVRKQKYKIIYLKIKIIFNNKKFLKNKLQNYNPSYKINKTSLI